MAVLYMHGNAPIPVLDRELAQYQPLVDRLLAKAPAERFSSARELLEHLHQINPGLR
jgi:hypothetical protein